MNTPETLHQRITALSPSAKAWILQAYHRFEDGEGYDPSQKDFDECLAAGLIERVGKPGLMLIELADGVAEAARDGLLEPTP